MAGLSSGIRKQRIQLIVNELTEQGVPVQQAVVMALKRVKKSGSKHTRR